MSSEKYEQLADPSSVSQFPHIEDPQDNEEFEETFLRKYCPVLYDLRLFLLLFFFLASGVAQPLLISELKYNGACKSSTFLFLYPNYIGMSLLLLNKPKPGQTEGTTNWKWIGVTTFIDCIAQGLNYLGLILAGSGIFTVIYASVTIFTAIFYRTIMKKHLTNTQWFACFLVTVGVAVSSAGSSVDGNSVFVGSMCIIVGSALHAYTYTVNEMILNLPDAITPERLSGLIGTGGVIVYSVWMAVWTLPQFQTLVIDEVAKEDGDLTTIIVCYAGK